MKKLIVAVVVIALLSALVYMQRESIVTNLMYRGLEARLGVNKAAQLGEGLHVAVCGAGGPLAAPNASGPCVAVIAGTRLFIVDTGTDSPRNLARMGFQAGAVEAVLLTHFHSDHIDGLGELATQRWAGGDNLAPLPVYGPPGVERVVDGFNLAYAQDFTYRHDHHGDVVAPLSGAGLSAKAFTQPSIEQLQVVIDDNGLVVEAFVVDHHPVEPAVGYRFKYAGRSVVITGDTAKSDHIAEVSKGVDLLLHDALAPNLVSIMGDVAKKNNNQIIAKIAVDIPDYHASPIEAAQTAKDAEVGHLIYYHVVPPVVIPGQKTLFLNGADKIFPDYTIAQDGLSFSLPPNSDKIIKTRKKL